MSDAHDRFDKDTIQKDFIKIVEENTSGYEGGFDSSIGPETLLGADLAIKSIDLVKLIVAVQTHFGRKDIPFMELLMPGGKAVADLRVVDVVEFLHRELGGTRS